MRMLLPGIGVLCMLVGTYLHPMHADPAESVMAFAEYAQDPFWFASHLLQFAGVAALLVSMLGVVGQVPAGILRDGVRAGATASLALAAVLQAVDGVALKQMVDAWAAGHLPIAAPEAVRAIEIGVAALFGVVLGATVLGLGFLLRKRVPILALTGVLAGVLTLAGGIVTGSTGFSALSMAISMPSSLLLLVWYLLVVWKMEPGQTA
jgi:hypothetical protein